MADDQAQDPWAVVKTDPLPQSAAPAAAPASDQWSVVPSAAAPASEPSGQGFWAGIRRFYGPEIGVAKSIGQTALGAARMLSGDVPVPQSWLDALKPSDLGQHIGKTVADVGQFFLPSGAISDGVKAAEIASPAVRLLTKAGAEGATAGAISQAQSGDTTSGVVPAVLGAAGTLTGAAAGTMGQALANRSESALIKAGKADIQDGFKPGNVFRYDLGGTLHQTYEKATAKLQELGQTLKSVLGASPSTISPTDALQQVRQDIMTGAAKQFGSNAALMKAADKVGDELNTTYGLMRQGGAAVGQNGEMALDLGNQVKQGAGTQGAWLTDPGGNVHGDPDQQALGQVYTMLYGKLKTGIDAAAQGAAAPINKAMSEIIPIRNAVIRRIPVADRANPLSLIDAISLATGHIPVGILNRALLSGRVANTVNAASAIGAKSPQAVGALTAAIGSQAGGGS